MAKAYLRKFAVIVAVRKLFDWKSEGRPFKEEHSMLHKNLL